MTDVSDLTVSEAKDALEGASKEELEEALRAEKNNEGRKTLVSFLEDQIDATEQSGRTSSPMTVTLTAKQVVTLSFAFGLLVGAFGMGLMTGNGIGTAFAAPAANGGGGAADAPTQDPDAQPTQNNNNNDNERVQVSADDDPVKGSEDAPVTIIEFSDFECPFCKRFYDNTLPQLESNYVETGKVKLVYRDLPLSLHPNAQIAAEAAECADEQGSFWEMHDTIFDNQDAITESDLKGYAADLGLDTQAFNSCLDNGDMTQEVNNDQSDASQLGATGTPTFFIGNEENGFQKLVGAQPYSRFESIIEEELSG